MSPLPTSAAVETIFREQCGRIIAALIRICRSFDAAEEALQEAFASALASWPVKGIPDNPAAWITSTAHRKLIDRSRRERTRREKLPALQYESNATQPPGNLELENPVMHLPDDRLRLMFTCCHPALKQEGQIALTLRTLGGLSTTEIAKAFLLPEPTLAQRLVRAKHKIQEAGIPYEVPRPEHLAARLAAVQTVIYLVFNEGYVATYGDELVRADLCQEAIRLGRVLYELLPAHPENSGLLALMLLHDARRAARTRDGQLVTLEDQDRSLWNHPQILEGSALLDRALTHRDPGPYQLQAAIAALHDQAATAAETDWSQIAALYERLGSLNPSPVIALNHAVAIAMSSRLAEGLSRIDALAAGGELEHYYLLHAARADILVRMNRFPEAATAYRQALSLVTNRMEREFLSQRLMRTEAKGTDSSVHEG